MANPVIPAFRFKTEVPDPEDRRKQAVIAFNQHPDKVPVSVLMPFSGAVSLMF